MAVKFEELGYSLLLLFLILFFIYGMQPASTAASILSYIILLPLALLSAILRGFATPDLGIIVLSFVALYALLYVLRGFSRSVSNGTLAQMLVVLLFIALLV